jgi:hypothetical protein
VRATRCRPAQPCTTHHTPESLTSALSRLIHYEPALPAQIPDAAQTALGGVWFRIS